MNLYETHASLPIPHRLCCEQGYQSDPPCMAPDNGQRKSAMIYAKVCQAVVPTRPWRLNLVLAPQTLLCLHWASHRRITLRPPCNAHVERVELQSFMMIE